MPRIIETTVYKFSELTEDAKQTALGKLYGINTSFDWWEYIYSGAERIGCKITSFDVGRSNFIEFKITTDVISVCSEILENHSKDCDTYEIAQDYKRRSAILDSKEKEAMSEDERGIDCEDVFSDIEDARNELGIEMNQELGECYLSMLKTEYEYLNSEEAIIKTIECKGETFTEDGELV